MSKEVLIPKKWIWDGSCTYSTKYEFLSNYFIKQPATAGTAGQVLALNSDLEPVWQDEGELPAPGTEGQVLALNASLEPIWKDDADTTTTVFQNSDISSDVGATSSAKGDKYIPTITGLVSAAKPHYVSAGSPGGSDLTAVADITSAANMTGMIGMTITNSKAGGILLKGLIRISSITGTVGQTVYFINDNLSTTAPSTSGQYVRIAGYIVDNPISGTLIYFNPSQDFILLS